MVMMRAPKPRVSQALALPAPTMGLNDFDPLANMDPGYMINCMNVFPDTGLCLCRPGYQLVQTTLGAPVKTLIEYRGKSGIIKSFAATDAGIYDISTPGTATKVYDLTNGQINYIQTANAGNVYLVGCNGVDAAFYYDGTTWAPFVAADPADGPGKIKGLAPNLITNVYTHNARLWFVKKDSTDAYYMPLDSIGGEAKVFPTGALFTRGGVLQSIMRWSSDTGKGIDDRLIFITTAGELASYSGTDPSNAADWNLDAVFYLSPPLGDRAVTEYGGDILIFSRKGVIPASTLLYGTAIEQMNGGVLSRTINRRLQQLTAQWQAMPFPTEIFVHVDLQWITINIYDEDLKKPTQLVMNLLNGAWGRFDYPVRTLRTINGITYMGTDDGRVLLITKNGYRDGVALDGTGGTPIEGYLMGAYTYLDQPTANKHAKLIRPVWQAEVKPSFRLRVLPDFRTDPYTAVVPPGLAIENAKWDISKWDLANWAGLENVYRPWMSANVLGYAFAYQIRFSTSSVLGLSAVEWVWEAGGLV